MGIYDSLGVRRSVNAAGPLTRLGGMPLHPEVVGAMAEAAGRCVRFEGMRQNSDDWLARTLSLW